MTGRVKALFMDAHELLIEKYLREHPAATVEEAVDATADLAFEYMGDRMADIADNLRKREKEDG